MNKITDLNGNLLDNLTAEILSSYEDGMRPNLKDTKNLPSSQFVTSCLLDICELLFPGYYKNNELIKNEIYYWTSDMMHKINHKLIKLILQSFTACHCCNNKQKPIVLDQEQSAQLAAKITKEFLSELPQLRKKLLKDIKSFYYNDPASKCSEEIVLCYPGFFAIMVYRLAHILYLKDVPLVPRIMTEYANRLTGTDINPGAKIGESFFIDHATGVVIGETAEIGDEVKIYQNVTIGALTIPNKGDDAYISQEKRHPTLGNRVVVYSGATILGGNTIVGDDCIIGGNIWLTNSLPAGTKIFRSKKMEANQYVVQSNDDA